MNYNSKLRLSQKMSSLLDIVIEEGHKMMSAGLMDSYEVHSFLMHVDRFRIELERKIDDSKQLDLPLPTVSMQKYPVFDALKGI